MGLISGLTSWKLDQHVRRLLVLDSWKGLDYAYLAISTFSPMSSQNVDQTSLYVLKHLTPHIKTLNSSVSVFLVPNFVRVIKMTFSTLDI